MKKIIALLCLLTVSQTSFASNKAGIDITKTYEENAKISGTAFAQGGGVVHIRKLEVSYGDGTRNGIVMNGTIMNLISESIDSKEIAKKICLDIGKTLLRFEAPFLALDSVGSFTSVDSNLTVKKIDFNNVTSRDQYVIIDSVDCQ